MADSQDYVFVFIKPKPDPICNDWDLVVVFDSEGILIDDDVVLLLESFSYSKSNNFYTVLYVINIFNDSGNWYLKLVNDCIIRRKE